MKNRIIALILALISIFTVAALTSCGASGYRDDVKVSEIRDVIDAHFEEKAFATMANDYIVNMMDIPLSDLADKAVRVRASGANIDEYGIFKASSEADVAALETKVKEYIIFRLETWMPEYMPEEYPKLEAATVKTFGQYVVYLILDADIKDAAFADIEALLTAE